MTHQTLGLFLAICLMPAVLAAAATDPAAELEACMSAEALASTTGDPYKCARRIGALRTHLNDLPLERRQQAIDTLVAGMDAAGVDDDFTLRPMVYGWWSEGVLQQDVRAAIAESFLHSITIARTTRTIEQLIEDGWTHSMLTGLVEQPLSLLAVEHEAAREALSWLCGDPKIQKYLLRSTSWSPGVLWALAPIVGDGGKETAGLLYRPITKIAPNDTLTPLTLDTIVDLLCREDQSAVVRIGLTGGLHVNHATWGGRLSDAALQQLDEACGRFTGLSAASWPWLVALHDDEARVAEVLQKHHLAIIRELCTVGADGTPTIGFSTTRWNEQWMPANGTFALLPLVASGVRLGPEAREIALTYLHTWDPRQATIERTRQALLVTMLARAGDDSGLRTWVEGARERALHMRVLPGTFMECLGVPAYQRLVGGADSPAPYLGADSKRQFFLIRLLGVDEVMRPAWDTQRGRNSDFALLQMSRLRALGPGFAESAVAKDFMASEITPEALEHTDRHRLARLGCAVAMLGLEDANPELMDRALAEASSVHARSFNVYHELLLRVTPDRHPIAAIRAEWAQAADAKAMLCDWIATGIEGGQPGDLPPDLYLRLKDRPRGLSQATLTLWSAARVALTTPGLPAVTPKLIRGYLLGDPDGRADREFDERYRSESSDCVVALVGVMLADSLRELDARPDFEEP